MPRTIIGLVGGIASGKSSVAESLAVLRPGVAVDADAIARRVLERRAVRKAVARRFPGTGRRDGRIDREKLAAVVFSDPTALRELEAILHPPVRRGIVRAIERAGRDEVVYIDAPLLQESGLDALCDAVIYVACPARVRRARTRRNRGWTEAEHRRREASQWPCARKRARADLVVDNSGNESGPRTRREAARVFREIALRLRQKQKQQQEKR